MAPRPRCYVAGPLGFTEAGRQHLHATVLPALTEVVDPVDPWALTTEEEVRAAHDAGRHREIALEIGRRNADAIRGVQLLAAWLEGQEPDAGTVAELGYAAALGIPCFGLRTDLRQAGEPGVALNLQVEWFVVESGGRMCTSLADLVTALRDAAANVHQSRPGRG